MKRLLVFLCAMLLVVGISNIAYADLIDGLVAYYPFSGNANDESSNGNNGTVIGATLTTDRFGNADGAYSFDSNADKIRGTWDQSFTSELTMTAWFKATGIHGENPRIVEIAHSDGSGGAGDTHAIAYNQDGSIRAWVNSQEGWSRRMAEVHYTDTLYNDNQWHHVAYVFNGIDGRLYVDSELKQVANDDIGEEMYDVTTFVIGNFYPEEKDGFYGSIDDIFIYDRALSTSEVQDLFNAPNPIPEPTTLLLLGSGLIGLAGFRRKLREK